MKKIAAALAVTSLALAGCSEGATDMGEASTTSRTSTASSTYEADAPKMWEQDTTSSPEDLMEAALLREGINLPPGLATDYADAVCTDLEDGVDPINIAYTAHKHLPMYDIVEHAMMVGASVGNFCPEYGYIIEQMGE